MGLYSAYSVLSSEKGDVVHLKPQDFRLDIRHSDGGDELAIKVRRRSLRLTADALELLRNAIAHELGLGASRIRPVPPRHHRSKGPEPILEVALSDAHLPDGITVRERVKAIIARLNKALKVCSPRHLKPKAHGPRRHERPIRRRTTPMTSCGGLSA